MLCTILRPIEIVTKQLVDMSQNPDIICLRSRQVAYNNDNETILNLYCQLLLRLNKNLNL